MDPLHSEIKLGCLQHPYHAMGYELLYRHFHLVRQMHLSHTGDGIQGTCLGHILFKTDKYRLIAYVLQRIYSYMKIQDYTHDKSNITIYMSNISRYVSIPSVYVEDMNVMIHQLVSHTIQINGIDREYITVNVNGTSQSNVLLCFPGGSETPEQFLQYTQFRMIDSPVIVFLGQRSANRTTFQNAFPWLLKNAYQNDVLFVDTVLQKHYIDIPSTIFLTGKSDGAGFAVLYSNLSRYNSRIKAIGICSNAYFGLSSYDNIGKYSMFTRFWGKDGVVIPYNIVLPKSNISVFIIHGTGDTVIPFLGGKFTNVHAKQRSSRTLWKTFDPSENNTYTPNIETYTHKIKQLNN